MSPPDAGLISRLAETDDAILTLRREMRRLLVVVTLTIVIFASAIVVTLLLVDSQVQQLRSIGAVNCAEVEGLKVAIRDKLKRSDGESEFVTLFEELPCPRR